MQPVTRRTFLLGSAAALTLVACGDSSPSSDPGDPQDGGDSSEDAGGLEIGGGTSPSAIVLVRRFAPRTLVVGAQRAPVVLGDVSGLLPLESTPPSLTARVLDEGGAVVADAVTVDRHGDELQQPYYPFALSLDTPGIYELQLADLPTATTSIDVFDPSEVLIPHVGTALPPFDSPTVSDGRGVDPVCTKDPPCPLHDITLTEALRRGRPVAYLIGTPAYCETGVCGPVLDLLLEEGDRRPDLVMVHAEVYTDDTIEVVAPAVTAYNMNFEPVLFVADATGTIVARLDAVYDRQELVAALDLAGASLS